MAEPLIALTLWPEWAWAITASRTWGADIVPKDVENRGWHPRWRLPVGTRIAIHAGKSLGGRPGAEATEDALYDVLGMFRRANPGQTFPYPKWSIDLGACPKSAIVALATIDGFDQEERTGWDVPDAWHWRLRSVSVLREPVPCSGAQGLWKVPEEIAALVRERAADAAGGGA